MLKEIGQDVMPADNFMAVNNSYSKCNSYNILNSNDSIIIQQNTNSLPSKKKKVMTKTLFVYIDNHGIIIIINLLYKTLTNSTLTNKIKIND